MKNIIKFIINEKNYEKRIDNILSNFTPNLSRTKIKRLILKENLIINGIISNNVSKKVKIGDKIILKIPKEKEVKIKPYNYNLDIIYEDEELIVLNKKAGISVHPGAGNYDKTIVNALINYNRKNLSDIGGDFRPGIVHRIDKDTSGLIVIAKNNFSHNKLSEQFKKHSIKRVYYALVWGKLRPQIGKIETFITRSNKNRQLMEVSSTKGKKSITNYKTVEIFEGKDTPTFSLVECKLETGRTHQIRVHLSFKGNNILGDKQYKKRYKKLKNINKSVEKLILKLDRQFLHAKTIGFIHPKNNNFLEFSSNLPEDLNKILKKLRNT